MKGHGRELITKRDEDGDLFQFSIVDFEYPEPSSYYGGVIYHIFVDRFNRGGNVKKRDDALLIEDWEGAIPEYPQYPGAHLENNTFFGGTLYGIIEKLDYIKSLGELELLDVKNKNVKQKNEAYEECEEIVKYIQRNKLEDVYIITPFVNQKELIQTLLHKNNINNVECGTIHSIQGAEKDTIIFSAAISPKTSKKTYEWIKNNYELINVAVTRAKNKLVIAADSEVVDKLSDKKDDLYNLVQYAKNNGTTVIPPNESIKIEIGKSNGSVAEDEFFKTVSHFCTCHKTFEAERNVKITKLFSKEECKYFTKFEFDMVLYEKYFNVNKPHIVFEINGGEHFASKREYSDRKKVEICKAHNIQLVMIPNTFVKAYEYIADIILAAKNRNTSIQQSLFDD